jgi:fructose-bisphosphate aldolase class II
MHMPLMTTKPMFDLAYEGGFAVGAFNVNNMEITQGIIEACASEQAPLILQISKGARAYANMAYLTALIDCAVKEHPELPIAIHLDHGDTVDLVNTCIKDGFTSVMIDGSHHPFEENIALTKGAVETAHEAGVVVEAELGMLGGIEEDVVGLDAEEYEKNIHKFLTNPEEAKEFREKTGVDSLAVAIGTSHGAYKFKHEAKLAFDRIEEIMKTCPGLPLVMHGSSSVPQEFIDAINKYTVVDNSNAELVKTFAEMGAAWQQMPKSMGVPEDQINMAVGKYGVCKVNIDTDLRLALTAAALEVWGKCNVQVLDWIKAGKEGKQPEFAFDPRKWLGPGRSAIVDMVKRKLHVLNVAGKAPAVIDQWKKLGEPLPTYYKKCCCSG